MEIRFLRFLQSNRRSKQKSKSKNILTKNQWYGEYYPNYTYEDIIGSPYSIYSYDLNPVIGTNQEMVQVRNKLNSMGLKVMLDYVPNHSDCESKPSKKIKQKTRY
jgi:hypothetical protein